MKYLCLLYLDEVNLDTLPESGILDFREELRAGGHHIASEVLEPAQTAATIRIRNGGISITDGPFAGINEQLREFCLIDARDLNDAIRVAAKMPLARMGSIEVRPVKESG